MGNQSDFDIDLSFGEIYEKKLKDILAGKIEVKTERDIWKTTGNLCIELEYKGEPSGINTTKADYWCQVFTDNDEICFILMFPVSVLKTIIYNCKEKKLEYGGDNKESLICLLPLSNLFDR